MITAEHRGISSLGWVLSLGVTLILIATLVVLPAMFELVGGRIESRRVAPPPGAPKRNRRRRPRRPRAACAADHATTSLPLASGNRLFRLGNAVRAAAARTQLARGVERLVPVDPSQEYALLAQAR